MADCMGDEHRLKQILINLLKNSLKFTIGGRISIILTVNREEAMLHAFVRDTGLGIKQEDLNKVFHMFGKLKRSATYNSEGLGLGLMICQNLV